MIEQIEELTFDAQLHVFGQLEPLGEIQIAPDEIGAAQRVSAEVAELAICRIIAAGTGAGAWIDSGNERIGIEPLDGSRLRDAGNGRVFVERHARNHAGILRAAALHDAVSIGRVRRAQDRKRQAAMPERGA